MRKLLNKLFSARSPAQEPSVLKQEPHRPQLNRFQVAIHRVRHYPHYRALIANRHPYGVYHHRPIIGEHTAVNGGVYLSAAPAEALVIDESYGMLRPILAAFRSRCKGSSLNTSDSELHLLEEVFTLANRALDFDPEKVAEFNRQHEFSPDHKVALDVYLNERIGVSRHRVLLAAFIIEKLREDGKLSGFASLSALTSRPDCDDETLVYTFRNGALATYDPRPSSVDVSNSDSATVANLR